MSIGFLTITIISIAAAVASAVYAWQLHRAEQQRSAARVAALSTAIDAMEFASENIGERDEVRLQSLFEPRHSDAATGTPLVRLSAAVVLAIILVTAVVLTHKSATNAGPSSDGAPSAAASRRAAPLELVSMRHERQGDTLKVSGLVRNPRNGGNVARVTAVVLAFNRSGAFVASGRAGLDFTTLEPGDESPFVVTIPGVAEVGRYRVSFRTETGAVRHIDRRADQTRFAAAALE